LKSLSRGGQAQWCVSYWKSPDTLKKKKLEMSCVLVILMDKYVSEVVISVVRLLECLMGINFASQKYLRVNEYVYTIFNLYLWH